MRVSKTWVAGVLREHAYEIAEERRKMRRRRAHAGPPNRVWGIDLTGRADAGGTVHTIFGIIDHGTRRLLSLHAVVDKSSWTLLGYLFLAIGQYGKPVAVRTDNERIFTARLFTGVLRVIGIQHQRTDKHCPWQNGRIERFFGTLKEKLDCIAIADRDDLHCKLVAFRCWYNHVRPHQHLHGRTPAEAWAGRRKSTRRPEWFDAWEGRLTGWFFPP